MIKDCRNAHWGLWFSKYTSKYDVSPTKQFRIEPFD
jgi:hypothetical protein